MQSQYRKASIRARLRDKPNALSEWEATHGRGLDNTIRSLGLGRRPQNATFDSRSATSWLRMAVPKEHRQLLAEAIRRRLLREEHFPALEIAATATNKSRLHNMFWKKKISDASQVAAIVNRFLKKYAPAKRPAETG